MPDPDLTPVRTLLDPFCPKSSLRECDKFLRYTSAIGQRLKHHAQAKPNVAARSHDLSTIRTLLDPFLAEVNLQQCNKFLQESSAIGQRLQSMSLNIRSEEAPGFNVFSITKRGHYEVTTHSRFLGALLDPRGSHEQGNLFLAAFLTLLKTKKTRWEFPAADHRWTVSLENDSIDILLSHPNPQSPRTRIIIENKWSAPDREQQLFGYWQRQRQRTGLKSVPAIYLTPDGPRPKECMSVNDPEFLRDLATISYVKDIQNMLGDRVSEVGSPRVKETILQYIELMEKIDED